MGNPRSIQSMFEGVVRDAKRLKERVDIIEPREAIDPILYGGIVFDGGMGASTFNVVTNNVGAANKVQVLGFDINSPSFGAIPDHTEDHVTVSKDGDYWVGFHSSTRSAQANNYEFVIYINNGVTETVIHAHRTTSTAGRLGSAAAFDIITLSKGDTVELWVVRLDGGAVARTITFEHVGLELHRLGG